MLRMGKKRWKKEKKGSLFVVARFEVGFRSKFHLQIFSHFWLKQRCRVSWIRAKCLWKCVLQDNCKIFYRNLLVSAISVGWEVYANAEEVNVTSHTSLLSWRFDVSISHWFMFMGFSVLACSCYWLCYWISAMTMTMFSHWPKFTSRNNERLFKGPKKSRTFFCNS